jgi:hypothetical protein
MGYFISSVIGPRHPPVALHAMYYTRTVFLSTDTLIRNLQYVQVKNGLSDPLIIPSDAKSEWYSRLQLQVPVAT